MPRGWRLTLGKGRGAVGQGLEESGYGVNLGRRQTCGLAGLAVVGRFVGVHIGVIAGGQVAEFPHLAGDDGVPARGLYIARRVERHHLAQRVDRAVMEPRSGYGRKSRISRMPMAGWKG